MIKELVDWIKKAEVHPLIKSCVFHYEFEFIHPFADGNGRMGRMWQTLLLYQWRSLFGGLPIESLIRERQDRYYKVLGECDHSANSGKFVEFLLKAIYDALCEIADTEQVMKQVTEQVEKLLKVICDKEYSTKELMELLGFKHRPTFRDNDPFDYICKDLMANKNRNSDKCYDYVLIDEAQYFKPSFYQLCRAIVKNDRMVWQYDDLEETSYIFCLIEFECVYMISSNNYCLVSEYK